jgi:ferredoxin
MKSVRVHVSTERCRGCGACVTKCPEQAITLFTNEENRKIIRIEASKCTGCGKCIPMCRYSALILKGKDMEHLGHSEKKEFWNKKAQEFPRYENREGNYELGILDRMRKMGVDFKGKTVIDAGCGTGMYVLHIAQEAASVLGVDISDDMLHFLNEDAAANGITNVTTMRSDWNEFQPDRKFDIAFCTMSPALRTSEARKKLHDCATGCVVYMGFDGLRSSDVLAHLCPLFGITPKVFCDAHKMRAWLDENGIAYRCENVEGEWKHTKSLDELTESAMNMLSAYEVPIDRNVVRANLEKFRNGDGTYTETVKYRSAIIVWDK